MRRVLKCLAITLLCLVLLILCILLLCYVLLGTDKGFNFGAHQLQKQIDGLEISAMSGNLKTGIQTERVDFKSDSLVLQAEGIDSTWRSDCLFDKTLCVDKIVIDNLKIETFDTGAEKQQSTGDIELPEISLPISFNVQEVLIKNLEFKPPGNAPAQTLQDITLSAYSEGDKININQLSTQYQNMGVNVSGAITPKDDYPLDIGINIDIEDVIDEHDISTEIILSNSVENLFINASVDGAAMLDIRGQVQPLDSDLPANLSITAKQVGWPLDTMQIAKADDLLITVDGDMNDYDLKVMTALSGEQIPPTNIDLTGKANKSRAQISDLTVMTLDGILTGEAAMSYESGVVWSTKMVAKGINPAAIVDNVDAKLNASVIASGDLVDGKWTLDLEKATVDGMLRGVPFMLNSKLQKNADNTWQLDTLELDNARNKIKANGKLDNRWDVQADVDMPELQNLLPDLAGGFNAKIDIQGELKNPDVKISANTSAVKYNELIVTALKLEADVKRGALDDSSLALDIAKVQAGTQTISNTRLRLDGSREKHEIDLFADGPEKTAIDLMASGGLSPSFDWTGSLAEVKLEAPAHNIVLREKTELAWNNENKKFSVDPHCWGIQDANLCLKNQVLAEETGKAIVELENYGLKQLNPFLPAESELLGELKTSVTVEWGENFAGGYAATLNTDITNGAITVNDTNAQPLKFNYETLSLKATADADAITTNLTIDSQSMGEALVDVKMDPADEKKPLSGKFNLGGFELGFLKAFLPTYETLEGIVSANGTIGGELLDPIYNGNVVLSSLAIKADDLPLVIDDGTITADIAGKRAKLNGDLTTGEGSVGLTGTATWSKETYRADLNIDAETLNIKQDPITESVVDAELILSIKPENIRIRGNIDIPSAEINIRELPKGAATLSEDVIIVEDFYAETQSNQAKRPATTNINLAVNVNLGDAVNLSGYGLDANLSGEIAVSQTTPNPVQLGGEVRVVQGTFQKYGQDLVVTDGQVLFVGPVDQTSLNIDAVRNIEEFDAGSGAAIDRVAGLHIDGRVENPSITLFTEPADKTQESILSYIILGRDLASNSGGETDIMRAAVLALALKGGESITDNVANRLGVQDLTLDAKSANGSDDDNLEVTVSSRVNDRLLVRYGRNVFEGSNTFYLRYDLTKQLYLEAAQGLDSAVDLFYRFSF